MQKSEVENQPNQGFFSGFIIGSLVSGLGFYLTMTEPGRKITRVILKESEKLGEKGQDYLQTLLEKQTTSTAKAKKSQKKVMKQLEGEI